MQRLFRSLAQYNRLIIFAHDVAWVPVSIFLAYWLRFNLGAIPPEQVASLWAVVSLALPMQAVVFYGFGCHRGIWAFTSIPDLIRLLKAAGIGGLLVLVGMALFFRLGNVPRTVVVLYPVILFLGVSSSRFAYRLVKTRSLLLEGLTRSAALVVGAGRAADMLIRDLLERGPFVPVAVLDDNRNKRGTELHGVPIVGSVADIDTAIRTFSAQVVLIAMPSAPRHVMGAVVKSCTQLRIPCRILPSFAELADGRVEVSRLRPVTVEDLLGRKEIKLDEQAISNYIAGKRIAVTGGGGSIGSELCRQVLCHRPDTLLIIDSSEFNLYTIEAELKSKFPQQRIVPLLGDIRIAGCVNRIFSQFKPDVVFHAAAYKHVQMVEENIIEGARNNILGTRYVADAAAQNGVSKFVQVSTDKTVNPASLMGAAKRVAEIYCQSLDPEFDTHFVTTRFGNVLGSTGSVVPLFEKQIREGGPVTVTHPDVARYFMTIPEAASLILQAGAMGQGGEIYVLDMGEPIKIVDLAKNMIRLSGLEPGQDIEIRFIGLRPGEKLNEELFYKKEELIGTRHAKLMLANCAAMQYEGLRPQLAALEKAVADGDEAAVMQVVEKIVPEFSRCRQEPKAEVVQLVPKQGRA